MNPADEGSDELTQRDSKNQNVEAGGGPLTQTQTQDGNELNQPWFHITHTYFDMSY